ncbi:molybdopterin-dependent oxidoreductase [bacterium]|nr:molybdopterin-dependent oxidoreductase [bacterium]
MAVETRKTTCNRDCPDACGMLVDVEDGKAVRLRGDPEHPVTRGFLCLRTNRFLERQYSNERLLSPLVRTNGELREASWEEALDLVARELTRIKRESGPAAIFHYRSGGSLGLLKHLSDYFFEKLGPVTIHRGDICGGAGEAAQRADFGDCDSNSLDDLESSRTIVLWGKNVYCSSPHLLPVLRRARERGARLALVDPVRTRTADLTELHLQPHPGGDAAVAFGVARFLDERGSLDPDCAKFCEGLPSYLEIVRGKTVDEWAREADVPARDLVSLASLYERGPSAILVGWGMQRRTNGAANIRAVDALAAVSGNMGRPGGGSLFYWRRRAAFDLSFIEGAKVAPRTISEPLFGPDLLAAKDPPVRAVWISCGNPVVMLPESDTIAHALASRELVVVVDSFLTDTARLAHVVLPTTTLLEDDDLLGAYGHHYLAASSPVIDRPDGVRTDLEILQGLAARVGLSDLMRGSARDWKRRLLAPLERETRVSLEDIERAPVHSPRAKRVIFSGNTFATPSGKARLLETAPAPPPPHDGEYPLRLCSLSTDKAQGSQTSAACESVPLEATVHPDAARGIASGERAFLASRLGRLPVIVRLDERQRRDVVLVPKGGWHTRSRAANALIRARTTDLGEGAAYYDEDVRLEHAI